MSRRHEDDDERTYTDVVNYLRQVEPEQYAAFKQYFSKLAKGDRKKIVGFPGILRALEDAHPDDATDTDGGDSTDSVVEATGTHLVNGKY